MRERLFKDQRGDTIMEVLICVAMLGFMLGTAFTLTNRNQLTNRASQERSEATKIAEKQVEYLRGYYAKNAKNSADIIANESFCFDDSGNIQDNTTNSPNDNISQDGEDKYISVCKPSPNGYSYRVNIWKAGTPAANNLSSDGGAHVVTVRWDNIRGGTPEEVKVFYSIDKVDSLYYGGQFAQGGGGIGIPQCNDSTDNDGDGSNNYPEIGCSSTSDNSEADPEPNTSNTNGSANQTPNCTSSPPSYWYCFKQGNSSWIYANSYNGGEAPDGSDPGNSNMYSDRVFDFALTGISGSQNLVINYQNHDGVGGAPNTSAPYFTYDYNKYEIKYCVAPNRSSCSWNTAKLPVNLNNPNSGLYSSPLPISNVNSGDHLYIAWINNHFSTYKGVAFDPNLQINSLSFNENISMANKSIGPINGSTYIGSCSPAGPGDGYDGCFKSAPSMHSFRPFSGLNYALGGSILKGPVSVEIKYRNKANAPGQTTLSSGIYSMRIRTGSYETGLQLPTGGASSAQLTYVGKVFLPSSNITDITFALDNDYYNGSINTDHNLQIDSVRILRP